MDICTITVSGNLVRDPEAKGQVTRLRLAYKTRAKDQTSGDWGDKSNFIDLVCFGKTGEIATNSLGKGSSVVVSGRLEQNEWTTANGDKRSDYRILVNDLKLPPRNQTAAATVVDDDIGF